MATSPNILDALHRESSRDARTANGAASLSSVGVAPGARVLEYWSKAGTYQGRSQADVDASMEGIFADDPRLALQALFHLRLISRKPSGIPDAPHHTGLGRKDEFIKAMSWLATHHRGLFLANLHLIPVFGCWKDLLTEPLLSRQDVRQEVYALAKNNLDDSLLRKYLPQIYSPGKQKRKTVTRKSKGTKVTIEVSKERCSTPRAQALSEWGRGLCMYLGISRKEYRKLKSSGGAHAWQQQMSRGEWDAIDLNAVPGKALHSLTQRKGRKDKKTALERHGQVARLRDYLLSKPVARFTGYPHDLYLAWQANRFGTGPMAEVARLTLDKQFEKLLEPFRTSGTPLGNVLCALDNSGSMTIPVAPGSKASCMDVCMAMGITLSALNTGTFKDTVVRFSDNSKLQKLSGSFCQRATQVASHPHEVAGTNFQSLVTLLMDTRLRHPTIPVEDFPSTILVLSDMQFNPSGQDTATNAEVARANLARVGLHNVRFVWWHLNGTHQDFPASMSDPGMYLISGFDPANLMTLLMGRKSATKEEVCQETPMDGMLKSFDQPLFKLLHLPGDVV